MARALVINNADFSQVAVEKVSFVVGLYIEVAATIEGADNLVSGGGFYPIGQTAVITASSTAMYQFVKWSDGNTNATRSITVTEEGTLTLTAEYEYIHVPNDFTWGNGGITQVRRTSGSQNCVASTKTTLIHAIEDVVLEISDLDKNNFYIYAYAFADTNVSDGAIWQNVGTYVATNNPNLKSLTIPAGKYAQIAVGNVSTSYEFTDLSILPDLLIVISGEYELT